MTKEELNAKLVFDYMNEHDGLARAMDMNEVLGLKKQSINNALSYLYKNGVIAKEPTKRRKGQVWLLVDRNRYLEPSYEEGVSSEILINRSIEQFTEHHNKKEVNQEDIEWMRKYRKQWAMQYTKRGLIPPKL